MNIFKSLPFKLLVGVILGIVIGLVIPDGAILQVIVTVKYILNQLIGFCVPLIIIGFIAPSIVKLGSNASRMLGIALILAYVSSVGAALFSMTAGYGIIPHLNIVSSVDGLKDVPAAVFQLDIPALLYCAFPICRSVEGTVSDKEVTGCIKRPFLVKFLVFYYFHVDPLLNFIRYYFF